MATYGGRFTLTYNQLRIKEKLGGLSPVQYRLSQAA
ncbi:TPA: IS3 family transposase [Escherichia coli]